MDATKTPETAAPSVQTDLSLPAIQLWSVRDSIKVSPKTTLSALNKAGYQTVEGFGFSEGKFFGMSVEEFGKTLKDNQLNMISLHFGASPTKDLVNGQLSENAKAGIKAAKDLGAKYLVLPYLEGVDREKTEELITLLNLMGDYCNQNGLRFAYHNHDFEFKTIAADGRMLMEHIIERVPAEKMAIEFDLYWVVFADQKPLDWFKKYPGRFELWHVKDMAKTETRQTIEVGDGLIDFAALFAAAKEAGLKVPVIELEHYQTDPIQGAARALANYRELGLKI